MGENHSNSLILHCERSELSLHFDLTKVNENAKNGQNLKIAVKQY